MMDLDMRFCGLKAGIIQPNGLTREINQRFNAKHYSTW